ncbi:unnamed protein product, partial [Meganyctiphanes norvegica]
MMCGIAMSEVIIGVWCLLGHDMPDYNPTLHRDLTSRLRHNYGHRDNQEFTLALDHVQQKLSCCGFWDNQDFRLAPPGLPWSCCKDNDTYDSTRHNTIEFCSKED